MKLRLSLCRWRTESFPFIILLKAITECQDQVCNQGLCDHSTSIWTSNLAECVRVLDSQTRKGHTVSKEAAFKIHAQVSGFEDHPVGWEVFERENGLHGHPQMPSPSLNQQRSLWISSLGKWFFPFKGKSVQICPLIQKGWISGKMWTFWTQWWFCLV